MGYNVPYRATIQLHSVQPNQGEKTTVTRKPEKPVEAGARHAVASPLPGLGSTEAETPSARAGAKRIHLYLGPMTEAKLRHSRTALSSRVEEIFRRYDLLIRAAVPRELSDAEWIVLLQALKNGADGAEEMIWQRLMGWAFLHGDQVHRTYGIDATNIARRVREGGPAMSAAIMEMVDSYWSFPDQFTHEQRMEILGLLGNDPQGRLGL